MNTISMVCGWGVSFPVGQGGTVTEKLREVGWGVASGVGRKRDWGRGLKLKYIGVSGFYRRMQASRSVLVNTIV